MSDSTSGPQGVGGYSATPLVHNKNHNQSPNKMSAGLAERAPFLGPNAVPTFLQLIWRLRSGAKEVFSAQRRYLGMGAAGEGSL